MALRLEWNAWLGHVIGGYQLESLLGGDDTHATFRGRWPEGVPPVAGLPQQPAVVVYTVSPALAPAAQAAAQARFVAETQALIPIRQANLLSIFTSGVDATSGAPYLVVPYLGGGSLATRLDRGAQPLAAVGQWAMQLAGALDALHARGIIHQHVVPSAILLDRQDQLYLGDAGLAGSLEALRGAPLAPTPYTPPEVERLQAAGPAADVYSVGALLYHLVTGRPPTRNAPTPANQLRPDLPPLASAAIMQALASDPAARFPSVGALGQAFNNGLYGRGAPDVQPSVSAYPAPAAAPLPSASPQADIAAAPAQHRQVQPIVGIIAAVIVVALIAGVLYTSHMFGGTGAAGRSSGSSPSATTGQLATAAVSNFDYTTYSAAKGCTKVGFLLPETEGSPRWEGYDHPNMVKAIQQYFPAAASGLTVTNAEGSDTTQLSQAENDIANGDCILIVAAHDSTAAAQIVEMAAAQHVPVIAYDRTIQDRNTAFYISFDPVATGKLQGQYVADHYQQYVTRNGNNNLVMIDGAQTDNNAILFKQGAHSAIDSLVTSGALKNTYEVFTPNWDNPTAATEMQAALTQTNNKVAVAYVANDGMAGAVIGALKGAGLAGKVLVTGQDATAAGLNQILLGNQTMTVYKPIAKEADTAAQLAAALSAGTATSSLTQGATTPTQDGGLVPSVLVKPVAVDKSNIAATVLADGFVSKTDICVGVPAGTDGIC